MNIPQCRFCRSASGEIVLDLGRQPACDHFPPVNHPSPDPVYPLRLWLCASCGLAQLAEDGTTPEEPRGVEPAALIAQAQLAVQQVAEAGLLPPGASVAEYGSPHGGSWLDLLIGRGLRVANAAERADVVVDCFGLMHARDQHAALAERAARLTPGGTLLLQFHSLVSIVTGAQWNTVRHGHFAYYSTPALCGMLDSFDLGAVTAWRYDLYGGTVLLAGRRAVQPDRMVREVARAEVARGVSDFSRVRQLQVDASNSADAIVAFLRDTRAAGARVLGYGAASRAVVLLNRAGITSELLPGVVDASPAKHGRRIPGTGIPVLTPDSLLVERPDRVLLFVPDLLQEARQAWPEIERDGGHWVLLDPLPRLAPIADQSGSCGEHITSPAGAAGGAGRRTRGGN